MKRISRYIRYLIHNDISILKTIYFNFHYFSREIALRFPIILYHGVKLRKTNGEIIIKSSSKNIKPGMVHIGKGIYGFQRKFDYTIWEQNGGTVIFENNVEIGKGSFISIGENAILVFENNSNLGGDDRVICRKSITIGAYARIAWDVQILDSDFKATINTVFNSKNCPEKSIIIGKYNWLCFGSIILKGSVTPDFCIVGAKTVINKDFSGAGKNILLSAEDNVKVIARGIKCDFNN